ncbi:hypothetical protein AA974_00155 [Helicobacter pylori]|nr:hypothetical protein AA974_00155 [Helicobacter pylori]
MTKANSDLANKINGLSTEKENLTTDLSKTKNQLNQANQEKENLNYQLNASQKQANDLKNSQQVLEKEKAELLREKERLTKASTKLGREIELERELVRLLSLKNTDKNELDLQNSRFRSEIEDLKRQLKE